MYYVRLIALYVLIACAARPADVLDADWQAVEAVAQEEPLVEVASSSGARALWRDERNQRLQALALAWYENHPTDPRRWQAVLYMLENTPTFISTPKDKLPSLSLPLPDFYRQLEFDRTAQAKSRAKLSELKTALAAASDVPQAVRVRLSIRAIEEAMFTKMEDAAGRAAVLKMIEDHQARFPDVAGTDGLFRRYLMMIERETPGEAEAVVQKLAANPAAAVRAVAEGKRRFQDLISRPLEMKFTAVDGREVDLTALRGKVVLIDFWATWCGPCVKELPNVISVYQKFHEKGFEVVGISLDQASDRQALVDFTREHGMPWPQHFDGKFWKNEIAVKYAINSIPAMFLLDRNGSVVSTDARGEKLGREVERLLASTEAAAAPDGEPPADLAAFRRDSMTAWRLASKQQPVDWESLVGRMFALAEKYPGNPDMGEDFARGFMYAYELTHTPAEIGAIWRKLAASPNVSLAATARDKARVADLFERPLDLKFTALDGREVDLAKLRGRVVLIDFWATWCVPCMEEMPNVKKVYAAYHDRGFEVIGVSCDFAPEQSGVTEMGVRAARTGPEVLAFAQKNKMTWPQHYEGRKHNEGGNSLAAHLAVTGIPAAFLIDQEGRVVAMNVRGEKLESEVKRLLEMRPRSD